MQAGHHSYHHASKERGEIGALKLIYEFIDMDMYCDIPPQIAHTSTIMLADKS